MKKILVLIMLSLILIVGGCGDGSSSKIKGAEFGSLSRCLESVPKAAKSSIDKVMKDTPNIVTGFLVNGNQFACERKSTGTKGVYYEGWYTY